jgi:hypothetical protein
MADDPNDRTDPDNGSATPSGSAPVDLSAPVGTDASNEAPEADQPAVTTNRVLNLIKDPNTSLEEIRSFISSPPTNPPLSAEEQALASRVNGAIIEAQGRGVPEAEILATVSNLAINSNSNSLDIDPLIQSPIQNQTAATEIEIANRVATTEAAEKVQKDIEQKTKDDKDIADKKAAEEAAEKDKEALQGLGTMLVAGAALGAALSTATNAVGAANNNPTAADRQPIPENKLPDFMQAASRAAIAASFPGGMNLGAVVALGSQALGFNTIDPTRSQNPNEALTLGATQSGLAANIAIGQRQTGIG